MFARSAFRAAAPFKQLRRYATEPERKPKSGNNFFLFAGAAVAIGGAAYYALVGVPPSAIKVGDKIKAASAAAPGVGVKKAFTGGDQGFVSLKLEDVEMVNHNTKRLRFKLPDDDMVSGLEVASAVLTKFQPVDAEKKAVVRPYTPISDEHAKGYMDLLVKKYPGGPMSTHFHDMVPGQRLDVKGPLPKYPWTANKFESVGMIAGGTGVTPMYQLCRAIFNNPNDKTKVTLVFGNIAEEDILLKKEFEELENTYPQRFRAFYVLNKPPKEWVGGSGNIGKELLQTVLPEAVKSDIKLFVCGPPGLMNAISGNKKSPKDQGELTGVLKELGYKPEQVYTF